MIDFDEIFRDGDTIPVALARPSVQALDAIADLMAPIAHQRAQSWASDYGRGYIEGQRELVGQIAEIIQREMAEVPELIKKELERDA